jgi:MFS family permease
VYLINKKNLLFKRLSKLALLSVSTLVVSAGAIAGNIPAIAQEYPTIHMTFIELLTTLPSLFIILTVLISPTIGQSIGYKLTVQIGLSIVLVAGLLPVLTNSFFILFLSRIFFGIGVGLLNPLLYSFAVGFYNGKELASVIGMQSAFEGIGGMIITYLVGQLLTISWRFSFLAYLIALPVLLFFSIFVPKIDQKHLHKQEKAKKSERINHTILIYIVLLVMVVTIYMSVTIKITSLLLYKEIGNATNGSNLIALVGLGAMLAGMIFGKLFEVLKGWTLPWAFLSLGFSMFIFGMARDMIWISIAAILCGFSFRTFIPYLFNAVNQGSKNTEKNTSLLLVAFNSGAAFAPISIAVFQHSFSFLAQQGLFIAEGILMVILSVGMFLIKLNNNYLKG